VNIVFLAPSSADRSDVVGLLNDSGHLAILVETAAQAGTRAGQVGVDLVLLDLAANVESLRFLRKRPHRVPLPIVCIADRRQPAVSSEALRLGVADVIGRPVRLEDLTAALGNAREYARLVERPVREIVLPAPPDGVFGASAAIRDVLGIVRRVAQSRCGVLIVGERGTGRETIARAIHLHGSRRDRPFIKFQCSGMNADEFGRVLDAKPEDDVTIFLEELGEMPPELQERLERRMSGPQTSRDSAISIAPGDPGAAAGPAGPMQRVIATAEPRIMDSVDRGFLRRTLLDLIAVVRIDLPPLRQRAEDVPLLATYFLKEACRRNGVEPKMFSRSALTVLSALPWPGNGSELRSLAERLALLVPRGMVLLEDVLANVRLDGAEGVGRARGSLKDAREQFERDHVTAVLQHHKGRMGAAAKELGIERTNLYRKIKQLKIQWTVPDPGP
jgi:DNA-binding NtrC family response regulator